MSEPLSLEDAPMLSSEPAVKYAGIQQLWRDTHRLLNSNNPPNKTICLILELIGKYLGADRTYTFSVTTDRKFSSCTNEWVRRPELQLKHALQNVNQKGLQGWLNRFNDNQYIIIDDVDNPPEDLKLPAAKFKRDLIRSIYVFGFFDNDRLNGYLGLDYVDRTVKLDDVALEVLFQLASTLNLFILRYEALELWNQTAKALPSALFIKDVDNDLRYAYANPRYRSIYGEDIIGKNDLEAFGEKAGAEFRQQDRECLKSGKTCYISGPQLDYSKVAKGYFSLVKFPVSTQMGRHYIAGFITDISNEYDLRMQALALLEQSKTAEKAKSMFLAAMSHEIRTPLNAIIGLVDELRHTDIPEETRGEYLSSVSTASRALLALINDVLDVSKIEAGQMHMTLVETDLVHLLAECSSIFSESCKGKGIEYKCEVSPDLPVLMVDTSRLRQILFNLIGNAVKFTNSGGIYVYGKFVRGENKRGTLTLEISDTGIGIAEEDQKRVFEIFEQASRLRGTSIANKGTGLGLCLCKRLAKCMNGDIELTSELGKGSTFKVTLNDMPYVEHSEASDVVKHRKDQTIRINSISIQYKVLIVDDVPMNLKVLGIILRRMNVDFVPAGSAAEALNILAKGGITHVLTDIWMPEMNGEALARKIRENPDWEKIRIAAQTADVEASNNFDASLFDTILSKPITPEKVLAFLRTT